MSLAAIKAKLRMKTEIKSHVNERIGDSESVRNTCGCMLSPNMVSACNVLKVALVYTVRSNDWIFSVEQIFLRQNNEKKDCVYFPCAGFFFATLFAYSALTACICNKCVWLQRFSVILCWVFFIHSQKCAQNWAH